MAKNSRFRLVAAIGVLALGGASAARAQDTSAAARSDTSGYSGYRADTTAQADTMQGGQRNAKTDTTGYKYTGPSTDTALKAKPGVQTGPTAADSGKAAGKMMTVETADTVVCKDGSNAANAKKACKRHGGVDSVATKAALNARGQQGGGQADTAAAPGDTIRQKSEAGYQYRGPPSDTALKAKPGTQTGADTGAAGARPDTSAPSRPQGP